MALRKTSLLVAAVGLAGAAVATAPAAAADAPAPSNLVTSTSELTVYWGTPPSPTVTAQLDGDTCANALGTGQKYSILATSSNSAAVTVSPADSGPMQCAPAKKGGLTVDTITVSSPASACTAIEGADLTATVTLTGVVGPKGIQDKIGPPATVDVTVKGAPLCEEPPIPPSDGANPAAPAVAASYLNDDDGTLQSACQTAFNVKSSWKGAVISAVAAWMPKPESVKDHLVKEGQPANALWTPYVRAEVNALCGLSTGTTVVPGVAEGYDALPAFSS